ncbi:MAG TPA: 3-oxoacyl-[acyl-carrier-protein] reductase [Bacteroidales bacterium]|jgi:3-oxoacyl-[acyl-carrier protein] reductase|nr:3-oxoacyl-[acyl-carrier-protein] reductase [Bacteroidales bacterium]MDI9573448.1 3-oxoacyl-[acyl-carrier-protein] reductase [Bacteroidota bacterium]OQC61879.1 MAG: 3-oxoacyl-(acyl-carrier-protein) reductase FabG [Bacteroidetes bacterium ADurb.Bin012]MBP9511251.1 3-oxoacyl-[acyl-carrier-protein] reductase [Bacteroidales bacterium]MBP9587672.1 3-oxoacyl-[acyl-carrier-protein] reductase [Bacteroidales bacterium]
MKLLEGKTALITGAARGIGRSIALKFASEGAHIAFSDLRLDEATQILEEEIRGMGVEAMAYASDASSFSDSEILVTQVIEDFGTIEILVNNAGITRDNLLMRMSEADWDLVMKVNLKSVFNLTKAVQKIMLKNRFGSIINMSSVVGVKGNAGQANYSASKAGIIGFTKSMAQELGSRNIRCNAVAPGFIDTEMTAKLSEEVKREWAEKIPLRRAGLPEDVANSCLFLASDLSSYITGQVIHVCGGMVM